MLAAFLSVVLNIMLIGSMLAFVAYSVRLSMSADNTGERLMRFGSLFAGALVVLGAQATGVGFSQFIAKSMSNAGVAVTAVSGAAGVGLGFLFVRSAYRGNIFAVRVMIFVGMLAAAQFAEVYAQAVKAQGYSLGAAVAPNIAFVVGIILCLALTYDPKDPQAGLRRYRRLTVPDQHQASYGNDDISAPIYGADSGQWH
jgi:hypothetical protein